MELSVQVTGAMPAETLLACAAAAERAKLDHFWIAENPYEQSACTVATAVSVRHPGLNVGIGIVSARSRHPIILAQDYLALANFSASPPLLGLGVGYESERLALGLPPRSGLAILAETIETLRRLGAGEPVPSWTPEDPAAIALRFAAQPVPIYVGAIGPKTLELTGRLADGVVFSKHSSMGYLEDAVRVVLQARKAVADVETFGRTVYVVYGGAVDRGEVSRRVKPGLAAFARRVAGRPRTAALLKGVWVSNDVLQRIAAELDRGAAPEEVIPDAMMDDLVIWGDPSRCVERLRDYRACGITDVALGLGPWLPDLGAALDEIATLAAAWRAAS